MTNIHISTSETFMTDAQERKSICPFCKLEATIRSGYVDSHCSKCNLYVSHGQWIGGIVYQIRTAMGFNRRVFAEKLGIKYETLKKAEFVICSKQIYKKTLVLWQQFVLDKEDK